MRFSRYLHITRIPLFFIGLGVAGLIWLGYGLVAHAASNPAPISKSCSANSITTSASSPFDLTKGLCIGDNNDNGSRRYFQFAVNIPAGVTGVSVTGKDGAGNTMTFAADSSTRYVTSGGAKGSVPGLGWGVSKPQGGVTCTSTQTTNIITITASGRGSSDKQTFNLCDSMGAVGQSIVYMNATKLPSSTPSTTGSISDSLCLNRTSLKATHPELTPAKIEQAGITKIELTGMGSDGKAIAAQSATGPASWYTINDGTLSIPGLKPGTYKIVIDYNDRVVIAKIADGLADSASPSVIITIDKISVGVGAATIPSGSGKCTDTTNTGTNQPKSDDTSSCNIPQLGWILCPILTTAGNLADSAYGFLADEFLSTSPSLVNTNPNAKNADGSPVGTGTYIAWGVMRNFANVAFVIVFLIVIFSQLTNVGLSNYGLKKMLPKLIIAAILVNLSFFICQIAVDISNIIGYSLRDLFASITQQVTSAATPIAAGAEDGGNGFGGLATIAIVGVLVWVNIAAFVVLVAGALVALMMIFVILVARKALIILLIVIAPLALVAYLLPNTEGLFKKWRQWLTAILMLFPIIGIVYGGSLLASAILSQVAGKDVVMRIVAAAVGVIPLFAVPFILKGSLNAVGGIGNKINSFGSKAQGVGKGAAQKGFDRSRLGQFKKYREGLVDRRRAQIQGGTYKGSKKNPLNWGRNARARGNSVLNNMSGNFGDELAATGASLADAEAERTVKNATSLMTQQKLTSGETKALALGGEVKRNGKVIMRKPNQAMQQAATRETMRTGTIGDVEDLLVNSAGSSQQVRQEIARGIHANGHATAATYLGGDFSDRVLRGDVGSSADIDNAVARRLNSGKLSAESMVGQDATALQRISRVATEASKGDRSGIKDVEDVNAVALSKLQEQAALITTDPQLSRRVSVQQEPSIKLMKNIDSSGVVNQNSAASRAQATATQAAAGTSGDGDHSGTVTVNQPVGTTVTADEQPAPFSIDTAGAIPPASPFSDVSNPPSNLNIQQGNSVNPAAIPSDSFFANIPPATSQQSAPHPTSPTPNPQSPPTTSTPTPRDVFGPGGNSPTAPPEEPPHDYFNN